MKRRHPESTNYAAQEQRFPLTSDVKTEEQSVGTSQFARTGYQDQKGVTRQESSRLDELISEDDIEWGE